MDAVLKCQKYKLPYVNWMKVACGLNEDNLMNLSRRMTELGMNNFYYIPDVYSLGYFGNMSSLNTFLSHYYNISWILERNSLPVSFPVGPMMSSYEASAKYLIKYSQWRDFGGFSKYIIGRLMDIKTIDLSLTVIPKEELAKYVCEHLLEKYGNYHERYKVFKEFSYPLREIILKSGNLVQSFVNWDFIPMELIEGYINYGKDESIFERISNVLEKNQFKIFVSESGNETLQTWYVKSGKYVDTSTEKVVLNIDKLLAIGKLFKLDELPLVIRASVTNKISCEMDKSEYQQWLTIVNSIITIQDK